MKDYLSPVKGDFQDVSDFSVFKNKQSDIKRRAMLIRVGLILLCSLIVVLFGIIISLVNKNNKTNNASNNTLPLPKNILSDILTAETLKLLSQWIPNLNKDNYTLDRLFKGTRHGCYPEPFINQIGDKKPTVIIAESKEGNIFGGYTESSWDNPVPDANAFLFSITDKKSYPVIESDKAIEWNTNIVIRFGTTDLVIVNDCFNSPSSTSIGSGIYDMNKSLNPAQEIGFYIKEIEAFAIKQIN